MTELETFLSTYGLWALFFAAAVEGDMSLMLAGMLVHLGIWRAGPALAVGAGGGLAGDLFYFWLGHGTARRWLTTAHGQRVLPRIETAAKRYGTWSLFFARYVYGARVAIMFFWGMRRLPYHRFLALDAVNCVVWAVVLGGIGYGLTGSLEWITGELRRADTWLLLGIAVFAAALGMRHYMAEFLRPPDSTSGNGR